MMLLMETAVSGVGFLGAGAILREGTNTVHGLTTAATIWMCMAIGLATGIGYWWGALACTILAILVLVGVRFLGMLLSSSSNNSATVGMFFWLVSRGVVLPSLSKARSLPSND
jgi:uncharacterized membrane protein YhiD involved in acid resistance